jgi:hypothetical protein
LDGLVCLTESSPTVTNLTIQPEYQSRSSDAGAIECLARPQVDRVLAWTRPPELTCAQGPTLTVQTVPGGTMTGPRSWLAKVPRIAGYLGMGLLLTVLGALLTLYVAVPIQGIVYDLLYLQSGPSDATITAILIHFLLAASIGLTCSYLVGAYLSEGLSDGRDVAVVAVGMGAVVLATLGLGLVGLAALPVALGLLAVAIVGIPLAIRYGLEIRSAGVTTFAGGVPVVVFLLVLAGFGVGWGWGYVVRAEQVPASSVTGDVASFEGAAEFEDDLFAPAACTTDGEGDRTCLLELREYPHESSVVRLLADNGLRCPYQGRTASATGSFIARHDGHYYRISCAAHGD